MTSMTVHHISLLSVIMVASPIFVLAHSSMSFSQVLAGLPLPLFPAVIHDGLFQAVVSDDMTKMFNLPFPHLFH